MTHIARRRGFVLKAVLELELCVSGETVGQCTVDPPHVIAPGRATSFAIADRGEELLVPSQCTKELGSELVFCLEVISECIGVANARDFEAGFIEFGPD